MAWGSEYLQREWRELKRCKLLALIACFLSFTGGWGVNQFWNAHTVDSYEATQRFSAIKTDQLQTQLTAATIACKPKEANKPDLDYINTLTGSLARCNAEREMLKDDPKAYCSMLRIHGPASALIPCPEIAPLKEHGTWGDLVDYTAEVLESYQRCKIKQDALIEWDRLSAP